MIFRQRRACAAASPRPTVRPSGPSGAVPATVTIDPTRTARDTPILGSYGLPLDTSLRIFETLPDITDYSGKQTVYQTILLLLLLLILMLGG